MPIVTIGIPVFNGGPLVSVAINSVLSQSIKDFEIIISDNSSTDKTRDIIRKYSEIDRRIKVVQQDHNIGAVRNFEYVRSIASGDYFTWLSHDDYWMPNHLSTLLNLIRTDDFEFVSSTPIFFSGNRVFEYRKIPASSFGKSLSENVENFILLDFWAYAKACIIYGLYRTEKMIPIKFSEDLAEEKLESMLGSDIIYCIETLSKAKFKYTNDVTWFRSERFVPDIPKIENFSSSNKVAKLYYRLMDDGFYHPLIAKVKNYKERAFKALVSAGKDKQTAKMIADEYENQLVCRFIYLKNLIKFRQRD